MTPSLLKRVRNANVIELEILNPLKRRFPILLLFSIGALINWIYSVFEGADLFSKEAGFFLFLAASHLFIGRTKRDGIVLLKGLGWVA
jgi:hypothetical protein